MRFFSFLIDPYLVSLREQLALSLGQTQWIESDVLPWILFIVYLLVHINTHDDQPGSADKQLPLFRRVLHKPDFIDQPNILIVDIDLREVVMPQG